MTHGAKRYSRSIPVRRRGFTLLELVVTIGILAVALASIFDIQGGAVRNHAYARQLTTAVQLARGKMLDVQAQLVKDGLSDFSKEFSGKFEKEGAPDYWWTAQVIKPEMEVDSNALMEGLSAGLGLGGTDPSGREMPNPLAGSPVGGLLQAQATQMVETLKSSVREIKLRVYWKAGNSEESFEVVEHYVRLPNARDEATAQGTVQTPGVSGTPGLPGQLPGLPPGTVPPLGNPGGGFNFGGGTK